MTRFGRADTRATTMGFDHSPEADLDLGRRRARAAALLTLALPGGTYVYQGEELGLPEVEDLPDEVLQDPTWERSGHTARGRDGCRVPLPWEGDRPPFGFTTSGARPWLPQPDDWAALTVSAQRADPASTWSLYRTALDTRGRTAALHDAPLTWVDAGDDVLAFDRGPSFRCVVNFSEHPLDLTGHGRLVLASGPCARELPPDTSAWLARDAGDDSLPGTP